MKSNKKEVEKKAKNKKFSKISKNQDIALKIILVLFIIIMIVLLILRIINGRNLSKNNKIVKELHNYLVTEDLNNCDGLINYSNKKINYNNIPDNVKLCLAYQKTNKSDVKTEIYDQYKKQGICKINDMIFRTDKDSSQCSVSVIKKSDVENIYYKIFGKKIETDISFNYDNSYICYLKDENYYCGLSEISTYSLEGESLIYRIIEKAIEKGSTLTIYDYFLKINNNKCYKYYTTLNSYENTECSENYKKDKVNYKFMKKYGTYYKHVYKKSKNGTYYWESSTPI